MEAALESDIERQFLINRQPVLQADDCKTVSTVDAVLQLIAAGHGSVFAEPRLNANRCFPA